MTTIEMLPCDLTDEEIVIKAAELAKEVRAVISAREAKKDEMARRNEEIKMIESHIAGLSHEIADRAEMRQVEVYEDRDYESGVIETIRQDTGAVINRRHMSPAERQVAIPMPEIKIVRQDTGADSDPGDDGIDF